MEDRRRAQGDRGQNPPDIIVLQHGAADVVFARVLDQRNVLPRKVDVRERATITRLRPHGANAACTGREQGMVVRRVSDQQRPPDTVVTERLLGELQLSGLPIHEPGQSCRDHLLDFEPQGFDERRYDGLETDRHDVARTRQRLQGRAQLDVREFLGESRYAPPPSAHRPGED